MALPMLLLAYVPKLIHMLPRSGTWMITVKQFMSFPLFATAIWLLWVLGNQKGDDAIFISLSSFLAFTMAIWLLNIGKKTLTKAIAIALLVGAPAFAMQLIQKSVQAAAATVAKSLWAPYDETLLLEKRKTQPVFIDFTASWCITCQVNKKAVLETSDIQALFREHNVFLMKADWTNQDPIITAALAKYGRNSLPLYVFYNTLSDTPQLLDEILTKDAVRKLFEKGDSK